MITVDKLLEDFTKRENITFTLSATNGDGEVLGKYTSNIDASDVAAYAGLLDESILQMAIKDGDDE